MVWLNNLRITEDFRMRKYTVLVVGLVLAAGWGNAAGQGADSDKVKIQGSWNIVAAERAGKADDEIKSLVTQLVFEGEKVKATVGGETKEGKLTLDATKKPKEITVTPTDGEAPMLGIYDLDGDTLKLCILEGGKDRPKDFTTKEGSESILLVLKRAK
jgi:uncharacterized protein (TIGR03067 family)